MVRVVIEVNEEYLAENAIKAIEDSFEHGKLWPYEDYMVFKYEDWLAQNPPMQASCDCEVKQ